MGRIPLIRWRNSELVEQVYDQLLAFEHGNVLADALPTTIAPDQHELLHAPRRSRALKPALGNKLLGIGPEHLLRPMDQVRVRANFGAWWQKCAIIVDALEGERSAAA